MADFVPIQPPGDEPTLSENALAVLQSRYLLKDEHGKCIETPGQLFSRLAALVAKAEQRYGAGPGDIRTWHKTFYDLMAELRFLPNSPALMNANRPGGMLSACFVLPIHDSIEGIFEAVKQTALIQKAGGGTGFSFDRLRPTGDRVASSGGSTSGPLSFWRVFSQTTDAIQQGAFRRGANMGMMSIDHPDILKFLRAKEDLKAFTNFNISVKITDQWMKKLEKSPNTLHIVMNPRTHLSYLLPKHIDISNYTIDDLHKLDTKTAAARAAKAKFFTIADIWKMIIKCAHKTGEPGLAFIDRINRDNPTPGLGDIEATNPCGEQPLLAYEACTLGSINLTKFVTSEVGKGQLDWTGLAHTVKLAVRFLDNLVDVGNFPVTQTLRMVQANRKIGLGVMGFADCLFMLQLGYDSQPAVDFGEKLMKFVNETAHQASTELADSRGPFPNWNQSIWRTPRNRKIRNAAVTCIAPTGTISIIAGCSNGIEPLYSPVFVRQVLDGSTLLQVNPVFRQAADKAGLFSQKLVKKIARTGTLQRIPEIPPKLRRIFRCTYDIKPEWHIRMQAAFQSHCDAAVSKTVNLPENATPAAVDKAYRMACRLGCKGITIYRRQTRKNEPMSLCCRI